LTRQHRNRTLQPAAVEPVGGIRSLKICETNPIYALFSPKTTIMIKNEPNSNPIYTKFAPAMLSWPAVRMLSTYSGQALRKKCCASSSLRPKQQNFSGPRATLKNMRNEPNFKNTKMNLTPAKRMSYVNFHPHGHRKNEPNLCKTNPISNFRLEEQFTLIYEIFILIFTKFYTNSPQIWALSTLISDENTIFHPLHRKNEPNTNPISNFPLRFNQFMKNMQNEPNLQNA